MEERRRERMERRKDTRWRDRERKQRNGNDDRKDVIE